MTIALTCPHCQSLLTLKDEYAGRRGACPKCKGAIQVPAATSPRAGAAAPPREVSLPEEAPPIRVNCTHCGKVLQGRASMAGKRVKCPGCGNVLALPGAPRSGADSQASAGQAGGGWFDQAMDDYALAQPTPAYEPPKPAAANPYASPTLEQRVSARGRASSADDELTAADWVLAILCTNIACIIGIYWMITGNPKGSKMLTAVGILYALGFGLGIVIGLIQAAAGK